MQQAYARLILTLVIAGALSCMAGLLFRQIIARVPCQGEGLACNSTSMRRSELAVLVQSLILRAVTASDRRLEFPEKNDTDGGSIPFPTE